MLLGLQISWSSSQRPESSITGQSSVAFCCSSLRVLTELDFIVHGRVSCVREQESWSYGKKYAIYFSAVLTRDPTG